VGGRNKNTFVKAAGSSGRQQDLIGVIRMFFQQAAGAGGSGGIVLSNKNVICSGGWCRWQ
jgi:hypothetical protein